MVKGKKVLLGYVAGIIYLDGYEWLATTRDLCSLNPFNKDYVPKIYKTPEQAEKRRKELLASWGEKFTPFVRPCFKEIYE